MSHPIFYDIFSMAPELMLAVGSMLLMMIGVMGRGGALKPVALLSVFLWLAAGAFVYLNAPTGAIRVFNDMIVLDGLSRFAKLLITGGSVAALLIAVRDIEGTIMARFEYPVLMSFATLGMFIMVSANDLLALYVGLELSSLSLYVLAAFDRNSNRASEAGLKYFVLGAISSGMLLFGSSLIYGYTGTLQFDVIKATLSAAAVPGPASLVVLFGMILIISAIAFKVSAVPFHMWTPDVYEGAPTSVTAFFAIVPKVAAIVLLMRLVTGPFGPLASDMLPVVGIIAAASMTVGAFAAIVQTSIKRLLAYSSIGNIGYALVGIAAGTHLGLSSVLLYMAIYMVMTTAAFSVILLLRRDGAAVEKIADLAGLSKTHPVVAYALAIVMFSMSGIPPMAGFFGKFAVFQAAVAAHAYVLAVFGVLTSVVAAWYYLNVIRVMFFEEPSEEHKPTLHFCPATYAVLAASVIFLAGFIVFPDQLTVWTANATAGLLN
ncbi:MAG: NADH-quinone oxidoreductase subunit NuoN [Alphaproteobacteria bacterium]|nr:NADH-quinone oxidoreductase subunit NuoN [Alphaproteobacteria bacterium]